MPLRFQLPLQLIEWQGRKVPVPVAAVPVAVAAVAVVGVIAVYRCC